MSAVEAAARALIGVRFRPQGRDPAFGLDCVGLAAVALRAGGYAGPVPEGYALRTGDLGGFAFAGLAAVDGAAAGDLLLLRTGPGQVHLAIRSLYGIIHADAALRRVVERPGDVPWPVIGVWRVSDQ